MIRIVDITYPLQRVIGETDNIIQFLAWVRENAGHRLRIQVDDLNSGIIHEDGHVENDMNGHERLLKALLACEVIVGLDWLMTYNMDWPEVESVSTPTAKNDHRKVDL